MNTTIIETGPKRQIIVWDSPAKCVVVEIRSGARKHDFVNLTAEKTDELIRALGLARVELSKARP